MELDSIFIQFFFICTIINREARIKLLYLSNTFIDIVVIKPRRAGKTTLVKTTFPDKPYFSLENPDIRNFANDNPRGFLKQCQMAPSLTKYNLYNYYILTFNKF